MDVDCYLAVLGSAWIIFWVVVNDYLLNLSELAEKVLRREQGGICKTTRDANHIEQLFLHDSELK